MNHRSILLIDDDEQIRAFLRQVLEEVGYMVIEAPNGQQGFHQFRQTPTALLSTDLLMPDGDGLEVTMALKPGRRRVHLAIPPVVAISQFSYKSRRCECRSLRGGRERGVKTDGDHLAH